MHKFTTITNSNIKPKYQYTMFRFLIKLSKKKLLLPTILKVNSKMSISALYHKYNGYFKQCNDFKLSSVKKLILRAHRYINDGPLGSLTSINYQFVICDQTSILLLDYINFSYYVLVCVYLPFESILMRLVLY